MLIYKVWAAIAFTICFQSVVNATGICGNATIRKHWSDCRKFVECGVSSTIIFQCPDRSFFNPETLVCDFSMYAECSVDFEADIQFFGEQRMFESQPGKLVTIETCNELPLGAKVQHPDYCNKFYHCSPSGPILFDCPGNLNFCSKRLVCNWPQFVDCIGGGMDTPDPGPIIPPGDGRCPENCIPDNRCPVDCYPDLQTTKLPHPSRCDAFLRCRDGCACFEYCESGLYWSTFLGRCVERYRSECEDIPIPDCPEYPCVPSDLCPPIDDPDNPIRFPHPERCDAYKKCFNGQACTVECPEGLEFDPEIGRCDIPWGCIPTPPTSPPVTTENPDETIPTTQPPTTQPPTTQPPTTEPPTTQPPTTQPPTTQPPTTEPPTTQPPTTQPPTTEPPTTQPPTTEPPTTQPPTTEPPTTEPPTTQPPTTQPPTTQPPTTEPPTTQPPTTQPPTTEPPTTQPPTTQPPITELPTTQPPTTQPPTTEPPTTPPPTTQPPTTEPPTTQPPTTQPPTTQPPTTQPPTTQPPTTQPPTTQPPGTPPPCPICPPGVCQPDDRCPADPCLECDPILLPHPDDCGKFLKCTWGYACEMHCPPGLHWSSAMNRCEWPSNGDCAGGGIPTDPPADDSGCPVDDRCMLFDSNKNPILLPYPDDCTKFVSCISSQRGCVKDCPGGLHWSVTMNQCEWPNRAGCDPTIPPADDCPTCPCIPCRQRQDLHPCVENSYCSQNFNASLSLPYHKNCGQFYKCLNGFACLLDCPDNTHYSSQSQHCVDPKMAKCILN